MDAYLTSATVTLTQDDGNTVVVMVLKTQMTLMQTQLKFNGLNKKLNAKTLSLVSLSLIKLRKSFACGSRSGHNQIRNNESH
jgi:hypothetical protein